MRGPPLLVVQNKGKKITKKQDNNRGSPMMLVKLYPHMNPDQRQLIDGAGFGGLLNCGCSQLFPELCQWLLDCFQPESCELVLPGRGRIPITDATVHNILGIPRGHLIINCEINAAASSVMLADLGVSKGNLPKISDLRDLLKNSQSADPKYLRLWTLFAACSVITPTFSTKVSPRLYPAVFNANTIGQQNWCELVLRILKQHHQSNSKNHSFKPCLTFLMILYLDSLKINFKRMQTRGYRVSAWTNNFVRRAIAQDTKPDGSFGALQLKPEFTGQDNKFLGQHLLLDDFINSHVPDTHGPQERLKAKQAVQNMCCGFSRLVSKFLQDIYQPTPPTQDEPSDLEGEEEDDGIGGDDPGSDNANDKYNEPNYEAQHSNPKLHFLMDQGISHDPYSEGDISYCEIDAHEGEDAEDKTKDGFHTQGKGDDIHDEHQHLVANEGAALDSKEQDNVNAHNHEG